MKRSFLAALVALLSVACSLGGSESTVVVTPSPAPSAIVTPTSQPATPVVAAPSPTSTPAVFSPTSISRATPTSISIPTATPTTTAATTTTAAEIHYPTPPDRDLYDLARRLVIKSGQPIPRVVNSQPIAYEVGRRDTFHVTDIENRNVYPVQGTLHVVTNHAYWYIADGVRFNMEDLEQSARVFEEEIRPRVTAVFGTELVPGVDNDVRLTVLHAPLSGVAGYYSSVDEYPSIVHPHSNQREMIYMTSSLPLNSRSYLGTLAHEFTHAIQFRADDSDEIWVNEGLAEIGVEVAGYMPSFRNAFLSRPSTSLINWPETFGSSSYSYGGANLFFEYLGQQYGRESLEVLMEHPYDSIRGVDAYLQYVGDSRSFTDVFADWTVANYLDRDGGGPFSYPESRVRVAQVRTIAGPAQFRDEVPQYGSKYYEIISRGPATLHFEGYTETPLIPRPSADADRCWWSNRGDSIDTTLTAKVALPDRDSLALTYSLWYNIEEGWDYAYVEVSTDGGETWDVLQGNHSSPADPVGNAFGPGYTGNSRRWLEDSIDLTPYRGMDVLLRFEYVTDDAIHGTGLCLDNISITGASLNAAGTDSGPWEANGFVRTPYTVPQQYLLTVIEIGPETVVRRVPLDEEASAIVEINGSDGGFSNTVVVVSAVQEQTLEPAPFRIDIAFPDSS